MVRLWSLSYSPWSDRARWALDHCEVEYERRAYQPMLGEPGMRLRLGQWTGPISVPVLETDEGCLTDSFDIARFADRNAARQERRLFPEGAEADIERFNTLSEAALSAGRTLGLRRILDTEREALDAFVPPMAGRALGGTARSIAAWGVRRTLGKYADATPRDLEGALIEFLDALAEALDAAQPDADGHRHLLGTFSYADITAAVGLAFILPPASHLRLSAPSRRAYTWAALPTGYESLFAWRDRLYEAR